MVTIGKPSLSLLPQPCILIVEDKPLERKLLTDLLEGYGQLVVAENGNLGLQQVQKHSPDLIITDLSMPVLRGDEMVINLRESGFKPPIIVLSIEREKKTISQMLHYDAFAFINKPIHQPSLLETVRRALEFEYNRLYLNFMRQLMLKRIAELTHEEDTSKIQQEFDCLVDRAICQRHQE